MQIGNVTINGKLALAPMAGVTDLAFRHICREHGAALTVTEMVSAKARNWRWRNPAVISSTSTWAVRHRRS